MSNDETYAKLKYYLERRYENGLEGSSVEEIYGILEKHQRDDILDKFLDILNDERASNRELRLKLYKAQQKIEEIQDDHSLRLEKIITENNQSLNLLTDRITNLELTIRKLQRILQPIPLTREDKKRQLMQYIEDKDEF